MSYALLSTHWQFAQSGGGGPTPTECDPYTRPGPTGIVTILEFTAPVQGPTGIVTDLCAPVS